MSGVHPDREEGRSTINDRLPNRSFLSEIWDKKYTGLMAGYPYFRSQSVDKLSLLIQRSTTHA